MHTHYIIIEGFSIVRIALIAWQRHIDAEGITKIGNAITFSAVKFSVDVNKISFNTFYRLTMHNG